MMKQNLYNVCVYCYDYFAFENVFAMLYTIHNFNRKIIFIKFLDERVLQKATVCNPRKVEIVYFQVSEYTLCTTNI